MKNLNAQELLEYVKTCSSKEKLKAAENRKLPPEVADYLVDCDVDEKTKKELYTTLFFHYDTNIWASTIAKAARKTENQATLHDIAQHKNTDIDTFKYLMGLKKSFVNYGLACNPRLPSKMLDSLADEDDSSLALAILRNPSVTEETKAKILEKYKNDGWFDIQLNGNKFIIK